MNMILMMTPEGEEVDVRPENFDAAISKGLEPALEYVTPEGETVIVRKRNFDAAEKSGLVMKPIYEAQKQPIGSPGKLASFAGGAAQWTLFGPFREEISGAIEEPKGALQALGKLIGLSTGGKDLKAYEAAKQRYKDVEEAAFREEPGMYSLGGVTGVLLPAGVGGLASKAISSLAKAPSLAKGIAAGAGAGAVGGAGEAEGTGSDIVREALIGAGAGGAFGAMTPAIGRGIKGLGSALGGQAARSAYSATGALKSDINKLYRRTPEEIGEELLKDDIIRLGTSRGSTKIPQRIEQKLTEFGGRQSDLLSQLEKQRPESFETQRVVEALEAKADEYARMPAKDNQRFAERLREEADIIRELYSGPEGLKTISLPEALEAKRSFDAASRFKTPLTEAQSAQASREARSQITSELDRAVEQLAGEKARKAYATERRGASLLQDAMAAANEQAKRDQANLGIGLRESIFGSMGGGIGGATGGVPGGVVGATIGIGLSKLMKEYGSSTTAVMLDRAKKILQRDGFQAGAQSLGALYGGETAADLINAILENPGGEVDGNFNLSADLLGSALLGPDLNRTLGAVGRGAGYAIEGRPFLEGFNEKIEDTDPIPGEGVASIISAALPTGKMGKIGKGLVRGVQSLDELLSEDRTKNAPNIMRIKMPDGTEIKSTKAKDGVEFSKAVDGLELPNENRIVTTERGDNYVEGYIDHPDYPEHTSFTFEKDKEGLWTLNSNFRENKFSEVPELKKSSTFMRNKIAEAVGGIGSDSRDQNTTLGIRSYLRDPKAMPTRPDVLGEAEADFPTPRSKFYTPGSEQERELFSESLKKSYGEDLSEKRVEALERMEEALIERAEQRRRESARLNKERTLEKERVRRVEEEQERQRKEIIDTLMNDPRYKDMRKEQKEELRRRIENYIESLEDEEPFFRDLARPWLETTGRGVPGENLKRIKRTGNRYRENKQRAREQEIYDELVRRKIPMKNPEVIEAIERTGRK